LEKKVGVDQGAGVRLGTGQQKKEGRPIQFYT